MMTSRRFLPTPRATDGNKGTRTMKGAMKELARGRNIDLPTAVMTGTLTSSAAVSPARTYPTLEKGQDSTATDQVFGTKCSGSFAWFDRDTSSWRTSQLCLTGEWELWSEGWPRSGTIASGTASRHVPLVPLTGGTGYGLWRTPDASVVTGGAANAEDRKRQGHAIGLHDQVNTPSMWPTPSSRDWKDSPGMAFEGVNPDGSRRDRTDLLPRRVYQQDQTGGQLNPQWVEWLMGYPAGWTDLKD